MTSQALGFSLNSVIASETVQVCELPLSLVLLSQDATYPWLMLVPRRPDIAELADLSRHEREMLMEEIVQASTALKEVTGCDKINVATFGNMVAQLHCHVIARFHVDAAWPKPVWGIAPPRPYETAARDALLTKLRQKLAAA
ncbi:MAG: HIT domain-containing protein [Rhodopseudomonas sp.]|nr:HIT domain-containing protein [Rhodopseudomonas sp.]